MPSGCGVLMSSKCTAEERKITDAGFQFLLLDTYSQLWRLLREYIASGEEVSGVLAGSIRELCLRPIC